MTTNCEWCQSKLEAYFSEELNQEDLGLFQSHLTSCNDCSREVQELKAIDPLVQQVLQRRLGQARLAGQWNTRPRVWKVALAGSGIALAAMLGIGMLALRPDPPAPPTAGTPTKIEEFAPSPVRNENPKEKTSPTTETGILKPEEGTSVPPAPQPGLDLRPSNGPEFDIIDASGEGSTLESFKGRVLLFGVVSSEQKDATSNLQELYKEFGLKPNVRILGVANRRDDKIEGANFPVLFNKASKLLGVQNGQFAVVDTAGSLKLKGSLANEADVTRARTQLEQLLVK